MKVLCLGWRKEYATQRIEKAAQKKRIKLTICEIPEILFITDRKIGIFKNQANLLKVYDVLIVRTFYPYISEALTIARLFKEAGKLVIDKSLTEQGYALSKMHDYLILARAGISVPSTFQIYNHQEIESKARALGYPCVLKSVHGSHGLHVHKINNPRQLHLSLKKYPRGELMLEEFLPAQEDYRLIIIGYKALPVLVSRKPKRGDFRTNFDLGAKITVHPTKEFPKLKILAEKSARILRREFAGVDIRFKGKTPLLLEVNRRPDFKGFEKATKFDVAGEFLEYVKRKFANNKK